MYLQINALERNQVKISAMDSSSQCSKRKKHLKRGRQKRVKMKIHPRKRKKRSITKFGIIILNLHPNLLPAKQYL